MVARSHRSRWCSRHSAMFVWLCCYDVCFGNGSHKALSAIWQFQARIRESGERNNTSWMSALLLVQKTDSFKVG
jgi:hypothetical protein